MLYDKLAREYIMIVKSADPTKHDGASLKKMLAEMESLLVIVDML